MRRLLLVLVASIGLLPCTAFAQSATPVAAPLSVYLPGASDLGEGWSVAPDSAGPNFQGLDGVSASYVGPAGARIVIGVSELESGITGRAYDWELLTETWKDWAEYYAHTGVRRSEWITIDPADAVQAPLPAGTVDALAMELSLVYFNMPAAVGLYALDSGQAVIIILEGEVEGQTGIDAMETVLTAVMNAPDLPR